MTLPDNLTARWTAFDGLGPHTVYELLKLRQTVFILEQTSLYADIDGKDPEALHFLVTDKTSGDLLGAIRLFADADSSQARIGRVVVAGEGRGRGLGRIMMRAGIKKARDLVPGCVIHVSAQAHLEAFYQSLGFATVSDVYDEDGIPHIDMIRDA